MLKKISCINTLFIWYCIALIVRSGGDGDDDDDLNEDGSCKTLSPEEILKVPLGCNIHTYEGCNGYTASHFKYVDGYNFVACELAYMCILVEEAYMKAAWNVEEEQIENAGLFDRNCRGFDLSGQLVGHAADDHHWLYCAQKDNCKAEGAENFYNCGTETIKGPGNVTFRNAVRFYAPNRIGQGGGNGIISFGDIDSLMDVKMSCSYQTDVYRSTPLAFDDNSIKVKLVSGNFNSTGQFLIFFRLYKNEQYDTKENNYYKSAPTLKLDENLFLAAGVVDEKFNLETAGLVPKIKHLWVSQSRDPLNLNGAQALVLISNYCETIKNVKILSNDTSNIARIKSDIVAYVENSKGNCNKGFNRCRVYIHSYVVLTSAEKANNSNDCQNIALEKVLLDRILKDITDNRPIMKSKNLQDNDRGRRKRATFPKDTKDVESLLMIGPVDVDLTDEPVQDLTKEIEVIVDQEQAYDDFMKEKNYILYRSLMVCLGGLVLCSCSAIIFHLLLKRKDRLKRMEERNNIDNLYAFDGVVFQAMAENAGKNRGTDKNKSLPAI